MMNAKNENKMTYVTALTYAIENGNFPAEVVEKLEALRDQTVKRNQASKAKPTKTQLANEAIKAEVVAVLRDAPEKMTVTEIVQALPTACDVHTTQKLSPIVTNMVEAGILVREMRSRKAYFGLA